jgi:hypothetical protein
MFYSKLSRCQVFCRSPCRVSSETSWQDDYPPAASDYQVGSAIANTYPSSFFYLLLLLFSSSVILSSSSVRVEELSKLSFVGLYVVFLLWLPLLPLLSLTLVLVSASPKGTGLTVSQGTPALGATLSFVPAILLTCLLNILLLLVFLVVCRSFLVPVCGRSRYGVPTGPSLPVTSWLSVIASLVTVYM